jgi:hypothetical protein
MIGFIAPYTFTTRDYRQYNAIAILHTFQFTAAHALTSRTLANEFITVSLSLQITREVFFAPPNSFLVVYSQSPSTVISRIRPNSLPTAVLYSYYSSDLLCPFITPRHGPHGKHRLILLRRRVYWPLT